MAEVPVTAAADATWSMLTATHLGVAFRFGFAGLVAAATGAIVQQGRSVAWTTLTLAGLAMFWYTRGMVSHAASDGDFSVRLLADWVHIGLISLWVGEVILSAGVMWRATGVVTAADRRARAAYVTSLSASATFALAGIFATGIYTAWRTLGGLANLIGNPYGNILLAKLLLVGVAALLGGFNRFVVMPPWLAREAIGGVAPAAVPIRFKRVLTTEAFVLTAIVVVAAWLASTSPPGEQM
jgi:putative copper resistance protein D